MKQKKMSLQTFGVLLGLSESVSFPNTKEGVEAKKYFDHLESKRGNTASELRKFTIMAYELYNKDLLELEGTPFIPKSVLKKLSMSFLP